MTIKRLAHLFGGGSSAVSVALVCCGAALWRAASKLMNPKPGARAYVRLAGFHGFMNLFSNEISIYYPVVLENLYEMGQEARPEPHWLIVEAGAHIGYYSVVNGLRLDSAAGGKLFALEPDPDTLEMLLKNIQVNNLKDRVFAYPLALFSREGEMGFWRQGSTQAWHLSDYKNLRAPSASPDLRSISVHTTTLDAFIERHAIRRIDLLKVNVEGAEYEAFKGGAEKALAITRRLVFSHESLIPIEEILGYLAQFGLRPVTSRNDLYLLKKTE